MPRPVWRGITASSPPLVDVGGELGYGPNSLAPWNQDDGYAHGMEVGMTCGDCTQWLTDEHHRDCGVCKRVESLVHDIEGIGSVVTAWDLIECVTFADTEACEYLDPKQEVDE